MLSGTSTDSFLWATGNTNLLPSFSSYVKNKLRPERAWFDYFLKQSGLFLVLTPAIIDYL
jgi:hypothetical protein